MPKALSPRQNARCRRFARRLVDWYEAHRRDLPWRRTSDPYAIWISEVMLQQTRVEAVIERYRDFLCRFPDLSSLARADGSEVLAAWAGLGYYRRARQLHEAARRIDRDHGSRLPADVAQLRLLPGFGAYTAGAVASIAFDQSVPAIDGNVERVLSRLFAISEAPKSAEARSHFESLARAMLRDERPSQLNQALMELGALVCTPRSPRCGDCPWRAECAAAESGIPESYPRRAPTKASVQVACYSAVIGRAGRYLFRRRPQGTHNAGLWELPTTEWHGGQPAGDSARRDLERLGETMDSNWLVGEALCKVRHSITNHRIQIVAHATELRDGDPVGCRWLTPDEALAAGLAAASRKLLERMPSLC